MTWRALAVGSALGILIVTSNLYMGLKTGWWEAGALTASILGFCVLSSTGRRAELLETNIIQTIAASMGAMPATMGFLGAIPALSLMGYHYSPWAIGAWGCALGGFGVAIGLLLKRKLLYEEGLPFPTAIATAELIAAMHSFRREALARGKAFIAGGAAAALIVWLRDASRLIPQASFFPLTWFGIAPQTLNLGLSWSPLLAGAGVLVGLRSAASLLAGAAVAWGFIAPWLLRSGIVTEHRYSALVGWLVFPGVAMVLGAAATSLPAAANGLFRKLKDLSLKNLVKFGESQFSATQALLVLLAIVVIVVLGRTVFACPPGAVLFALILSVILASVASRAAGQTDIVPLGKIGRITQLLFGVLAPGSAVINTVAGSVVAGDAAQTASVLYALQAGRKLAASPRQQIRAQLGGVLLGALVSVPIYVLFVKTYGLGSLELPVPSAVEWKAVAETVSRGMSGPPPLAARAASFGFAAGVALTMLSRTRWSKFFPVSAAAGLAFIVPAHYSATIFLGAALLAIAKFRNSRRVDVDTYRSAVGGGAIAGESLMGVLIAVLMAFRLLPS